MWGFTKFAWYLVRSSLLVGVMALAAPGAAQEVDVPTTPPAGDGRGTVFAPSAWSLVSTPLQKRVALNLSGFYIGELQVPVAQVDLPIRLAKFLTVTPSYMGYTVPASGLNKLPAQPGHFTDSYEEHQFRVDATVWLKLCSFEISARNMYVRRFRPTPVDDMNRYRGRVAIARPVAVAGRTLKPFASYETFYEPTGGWNRDRLWSGVTVPLNKRLFLQPSYMWESSEGNRDVQYLLIGLIVNTR